MRFVVSIKPAVKLFLVFLVSVDLLAAGLSPNQEGENQMKSFSLPFAEILPREISGWTPSRDDQVFGRDDIFDYMDGGGEIYLAYDFRALLVREYTKADAPAIVVEIYQMSSSEDAYGVFTHDTDGDALNLGQGAVYGAGLLRFWKDTVFVRIMADRETPEAKAVVMKLGETIAAAIPKEGAKPSLLDLLATDGLLTKSLRYFHTQILLNAHYYLANVNILSLSPKTQAVLARYERNKAQARVLLVGYPSAAKAFDAGGRFVEMFLLERFDPEGGEVEPKKLENGKYAGIIIRGTYLIIVIDADNRLLLERLSREISKKVEGKES
jgi:hypothetical protein